MRRLEIHLRKSLPKQASVAIVKFLKNKQSTGKINAWANQLLEHRNQPRVSSRLQGARLRPWGKRAGGLHRVCSSRTNPRGSKPVLREARDLTAPQGATSARPVLPRGRRSAGYPQVDQILSRRSRLARAADNPSHGRTDPKPVGNLSLVPGQIGSRKFLAAGLVSC